MLQVAFVLANGPLAWAIVVWRNSFVFHSVDKFTSVVIHALPPLVMYCERWHLAPASASALGADALLARLGDEAAHRLRW